MNKAQTRLTPGTYRLGTQGSHPLDALRKDQRRTRDWRYNPIKSGQLFFYKEWTYAPGDDETKLHTEQRIYPVGEHLSVRPDESAETRVLEELLVRVEDTPTFWLRREHSAQTALEILDALAASGKVTLDEMKALVDKDDL